MWHVVKVMCRLLVSEDGPTAVEYAVMLALIVAVCLAAIGTGWHECQHDVPKRGGFAGQLGLGQALPKWQAHGPNGITRGPVTWYRRPGFRQKHKTSSVPGVTRRAEEVFDVWLDRKDK